MTDSTGPSKENLLKFAGVAVVAAVAIFFIVQSSGTDLKVGDCVAAGPPVSSTAPTEQVQAESISCDDPDARSRVSSVHEDVDPHVIECGTGEFILSSTEATYCMAIND
ncbi:MAG: hypothetical protein U0R24_00950 [Solirubrobacterales bacterium]